MQFREYLELDSKELTYLIASTLVLGFCFSFRDWGFTTFDFGFGIRNLIITTLLVGISIFAHEVFHRSAGAEYKAKVKTISWKALLLFAVIATILTNGYIVFAAIWTITITPIILKRPGFGKANLGPRESARIALAGPLINFTIMIIAGLLLDVYPGNYILSKLVFINFWLAWFNLFPFFRVFSFLLLGAKRQLHNLSYRIGKMAYYSKKELPFMEGEYIFFGSKPMWAFMFFIVTITGLMYNAGNSILASLITGGVIAFIIYLVWEFMIEPWSLHATPQETHGGRDPTAYKKWG